MGLDASSSTTWFVRSSTTLSFPSLLTAIASLIHSLAQDSIWAPINTRRGFTYLLDETVITPPLALAETTVERGITVVFFVPVKTILLLVM